MLETLDRASSPLECVAECQSRYYKFAGLTDGQKCYCGSTYGRNGESRACTIPCVTDASAFCGSHEAVSVYATSQKGPSPPRRIQVNRMKQDEFKITWEPPILPNGNVTLYKVRAVSIDTHAFEPLPPVESRIQGGTSNETTLGGLQPGTKYNVSVTAVNEEGNGEPAYAVEWTPIGPPCKPDPPKLLGKSDTTVTIILTRSCSENGPVSAYQVVVVRPGIIPPFGADAVFPNYNDSIQEGLGYYVTGEFEARDFEKYERFTVGNGGYVGGYYNAPLMAGAPIPRIGAAIVSRARDEMRYGYSDLTEGTRYLQHSAEARMDSTAIVLCVAIGILGTLLVASIFLYVLLKRRHRKGRERSLSERRELTLQGPIYEVDNVAYIPEDVPERADHYHELKNKVWSIPRNFLSVDAVVLRRGRFGTIHSGTVKRDGTPSRVCVHGISDGLLRGSEKKMMLRELDVCIRAGSHEYLAGLTGTCETPDTLYVVFEMPPFTLKDHLLDSRSGGSFPSDRILPIGARVAQGLRYLASQKIAHERLCARTVGIAENWIPKITGHGLAKHSTEDLKYIRWTAVECFDRNSRRNHQPGVVWAFGVLIWEMLSVGGTPYADLELDSDLEEAVSRGLRPRRPPDVPDPLYEVVLSCWQSDPEERPSFDELVRLDTLSICPITAITEPYVPELELN
ncbi:putative tyrosine-protein kinase Wsck isoform X2 [Orussus abietinus]|uniref:putative tyrosine-protein kinase Wsck isoform X2 n=1 Tax=Orussus abietinus TaxID=222816 RepID=UPI000626804E|nr:putative tyrosine-protein kinase Wsck isoform X2 [Orussus abietinus]